MPLKPEVVASIIGGAGAIGVGALNFGSSAHSAKKAFKYQIQAMNHQYNLTRQLNQNAYQDTTYSMREAGINPMLAITQGINGMSAGSGGSVPVNDPQLGNSALQGYATYKSLKNETELKDSQKSLNHSQENLNQHSADAAHEQAALSNEQTRQLMEFGPAKQQAEIGKILQDIENSKELTKAQVYNLKSTGDAALTSAKASHISANASSKESYIRSKTYTVDTGYGVDIPKLGRFGIYNKKSVK